MNTTETSLLPHGPLLGASLGAYLALVALSVAAQETSEAPMEALSQPSPDLVDSIPVDATEAAAATDEAEPSSRNRLIEEIIVTAQKREENLKDVPVSVAAFSATQLDARGVLDASDLPRITPGLTVINQVGYTSTFLRGVGSDAFLLGDPAVTTYFDGVYLPFAAASTLDFGSIDRVEVLKGPQGTLFGRNALGGAVKIETRSPSLEHVESSVQTIYTDDPEGSKSRGYLSVPLTNWFAFSVGGIYNHAESHLDGRQGIGRDPLPDEITKAYRLQTLLQPVDWLSLKLNYTASRLTSQVFAVNTDPSLAGSLLIAPQDPRHGSNDTDAYITSDNRIFNGKLGVDAGPVTVNLFGSHQRIENTNNYDFDGSPTPIANFRMGLGFSKVETAELQLLSNRDFPGSEWLELQAGVYYFKQHAGFDPAFLTAGGVDLVAGQLAGVQLPDGLTNALASVLGALPVPNPITVYISGVLDTQSIAYYTQNTAHFTDWASVTVGARYQTEKRLIDRSQAGLYNADGSATLIPGQNYSGHDDPRYRKTSNTFDPKVSFNFRPAGDWFGDNPLLYLSYQTATTSDTYNTINIYQAPDLVKGTKIKAYELGLKTRLLDDLVDLNVAAFHYDIDKPQIQIVSLTAGGAVRLENAGAQRIRGAEFDTVIQLFPEWTHNGLVLSASAAYLDAKYTSYENGSGFDERTGLFSGNNDFTGNRIPRTPKLSGTVALSQQFELERGSLEVAADYYHTGSFYYLAQATSNVQEQAYGLLGAHVSYLYDPWNLRLTVFGTNLLDEDYNLSRFRTDFGINDTPAPLSVYGLRLNWDFR